MNYLTLQFVFQGLQYKKNDHMQSHVLQKYEFKQDIYELSCSPHT